MNEIGIGHNQPDMTQTAKDTMADLNEFLKEHPIIQDEETAREAKIFIDRAKLCIADVEDERTAKVRPLNEEVKRINQYYGEPRELLREVLNVLEYRITDFLAKEEAKRIAAAEDARRVAERAEQAAREAERFEKEQLSSAALGELDVDVGAAIAEADRVFAAYEKAERQAKIAERETKVKLGGGFTRALSLRDVETIHVTDLLAAVEAMKDSGRIVEAVIKSARSYKKVFGKYPPGIEISVERKA